MLTPENRLDTMTKAERSLLLYLEARAVDHGGLVSAVHMNADDLGITRKWNAAGFLNFSRIPTDLWDKVTVGSNSREDAPRYVVELNDLSWPCAEIERRRRAERSQRKEIVQASLAHFNRVPA